MSGEPQSKRLKLTDKKGKWNHFKKPNRNARIEIGNRGFLATCNFREKDCRRETFNILTTYADQLFGTGDENDDASSKMPDVDETEDDISTELQNEIDAINATNKKKSNRFQHLDTEMANLVFVKTTLRNPVELGAHIVSDIASTRKSASRFLLRFIPVEIVCKATIDDIKTAAGKLFDVHFLNCPPKTFSIVINKRYNNSIQKDIIIEELAGLVAFKNVHHKVDLKNAECSVIVEILKGICCLSVLPNYLKWKKYNITELVLASKVTPVAAGSDTDAVAAVVTADSKSETVETIEKEEDK
ncbi:THUMP domain-containing protein 1 homolog [Bradysia coprophila]|uniref:THUMP domain-containing protein 1 homolog n=1 Tax=Bradysia coprophila TaxID=38358 RepID=UPI00187DBA6D|nr:THUMP domain-containing protein 1 homolog [Bradysia coprophila]XP_037050967.1 THUMP domain-containing protein 1 homolog [Bradysia coprophila]